MTVVTNSTNVKISIKKVEANSENMASYMANNAVKRSTERKSNLNYGRIAIMTDADVD